jgi:hypothetical protein
MINTQVEGRTPDVCRSRFQALAHRQAHRTGKRQCQVQIGSRHPLYAFAQQFGGSL